MPDASPQPQQVRTKGALIGAVVIGVVALAFIAATIAAFQTQNEDQRKLLIKIGGGLALIFGALPKTKRARSERTRLLELGWTLFVVIGLIFAAGVYWSIFDSLTEGPWGYVFIAVALGMIVWGHSLPKESGQSPQD